MSTEQKQESRQERLERIFAFCREIDREKEIVRQTWLADGSRKEDDAEHAWHMAVMAMLLADYANTPVDVGRVMQMCLIHDLVEVYAGDTYAYDTAGKKTQRAREEEAAERLFGLLPDDLNRKLRALFEEFDAGKSDDARFARVLDNIQPLMLNGANAGKSWEEHGVHLSQVLHRNERTPLGSEEIWAYAQEHFIRPSLESGVLDDDVHGGKKG